MEFSWNKNTIPSASSQPTPTQNSKSGFSWQTGSGAQVQPVIKESNTLIKAVSKWSDKIGLSDMISDIKNDLLNIKGTLPQKKNLLQTIFTPVSINDPKKFLDKGLETFKYSIQAEKESLNKVFTTKPGSSERLGATLETLHSTAGVALSPIAAFFSAAETIPVLGTGVKIMNAGFHVAGEGGRLYADAIVDKLPVDNKVKDNIRKGVGDIFSLAAQIALGKAGEVGYKKINSFIDEKTTPKAVELKVQSQGGETIIPVNTPASRYAAYLKSQGYEPYVNPESLPVIQIGPKGKSTLPTIDFETNGKVGKTPRNTQAALRYEYGLSDAELILQKANELVTPKETKPIEFSWKKNQTESNVSKTALDIKTRAEAEGITNNFGELPDIGVMKLAEQSKLAEAFVSSNIEKARRISLGEEPAPSGIETGSIFRALEKAAFETGDINILRDLAYSKVPTETARALKSFDVTTDATSPVTVIQELKKIKEELSPVRLRTGNLERAQVQVKQKIMTEIDRVREIKPKTWEDFTNSLIC